MRALFPFNQPQGQDAARSQTNLDTNLQTFAKRLHKRFEVSSRFSLTVTVPPSWCERRPKVSVNTPLTTSTHGCDTIPWIASGGHPRRACTPIRLQKSPAHTHMVDGSALHGDGQCA